MPDEVSTPKVAIVYNMEIKSLELIDKKQGPFTTTLNVTSGDQLPTFISEEARLRRRLVEKVKMAGANVLISRAKLTDRISDKLSREGIFALQMVDQKEIDEVAMATGATIVGDTNDISEGDIGSAEILVVDKVRPEEAVRIADKGAEPSRRGADSPE